MVYDLDIAPGKLDDQRSRGIAGSMHTNSPKPYTKYEYKGIVRGSFVLLTVSYNGKVLEQIRTPTHEILKLCTYFTDDEVLMAVHIKFSEINYYYTTVNNSSTTGHNIKLQEFQTANELDEKKELKIILDNVNINKTLDYQGLPKKIREKLSGKKDIFFDLHRTHWEEGYASEVTKISIKITHEGGITGYKVVQHKPKLSSFYIKRLYNTHYQPIILENGYPNELLNSFTAYYKEEGSWYNRDPMMVILNVQENNDHRRVSGKYIITKYDYTTWSIRRIGITSISNTDIAKIVKEIADDSHHRLNIHKLPGYIRNQLKDITEDLVLDLTKQLNQSDGTYLSVDDMKIPYKQTYTGQYLVVSHGDAFTSFTVQDVKVKGVPIDDSLIPKNTRFSRFYVYYRTNSTDNPLLIYILQSNDTKKWICRYDGCDQWMVLKDKIPDNDNDSPGIMAELSSLNVPIVVMDVSKNVGLYTPAGGDTKFYVSKTIFSGFSFYKYTQQRGESNSESYPFKISHICYNTTTLYGIESQEILSSVGAFYDGEPPIFGDLFLIEIVTYNPKKYWYYQRVDKSGTTWTKLYEQGYSVQLSTEQIKEKLVELKDKLTPKPAPPTPAQPKSPIPSTPQKPSHPETPKQTPTPSPPPKVVDDDHKHEDSENEEQDDYKDYSSYGHSAGAIIGGIIGCVLCIGLAALGSRMFAPRIKAFMLTRHHLL